MSRELKRAIITGATGMIGSNLTKLLLNNGIDVTAVVRPGSLKLTNLPAESDVFHKAFCSVDDIENLQTEPADAWFHFAWKGVYGADRNDMVLQAENVTASLKAAEKAAALGCKVFLFAGSQAEYGSVQGVLREDTPMDPETGYGKMKKQAEERLREKCAELGMDFVCARILSVYGPGDNAFTLVMSAINGFLEGKHMAFTKGEQVWDYLYAEDAADAFYRMALSGKNGRSYVLGSGRTGLLKEYIEIIRDEAAPGLSIGLGELPYRENQVMHLQADIGPLTEDTGFLPKTDFKDGIRKTIEYARERNRV